MRGYLRKLDKVVEYLKPWTRYFVGMVVATLILVILISIGALAIHTWRYLTGN